ncbi:hypothetical protein FQN60_000403 [Etheostoma spectabile]|uniref:Uncharacterized protein n=1 Tax=Etheostoma spectabile TaxID=54343 RepID=A0A5J5CY37_9PERO|nr:hypothetical protein FQN60_000403 [Etheostoma spectabile]
MEITVLTLSRDTAGVCFRVAQGDVTVEVDLLIVPDELKDGNVEATAESVIAVAGRRGPAHVYYEDELVFICPFHKDTHEEDVSRAQHHLPLPVRVPLMSTCALSDLSMGLRTVSREIFRSSS